MAPNRICTTALVLLVSLPSALASLMNGAGCDTTTNFDIDTVLSSAQAYGNSENVFMPPGCTCKESGVAKPECVIFDCDCKCDLTAGVCDMNCCCDTECTAAQITKFSTNCLDSGVSDPVYQTCHSPYEVAKINPKYPMRSDDSAENAYKNLLCVQTDNSGTKGVFFDTGRTKASLYPSAADVFSDKDCNTEFDYTCNSRATSTLSSSSGHDTTDEFFLLGDTIASTTGVAGSSSIAEAFGGALPLPKADQRGYCNENNRVQFGESTYNSNDDVSNTCIRPVGTLSTTCTAEFDYKRFVENMFVSSKYSAAIAADSTTDFVAVAVSSIKKGNTYLYGNGGGTTLPTASHSGTTCSNALKSLCYEIVYDVDFKITAVNARIELADVDSSSATFVEQDFSVEFSTMSFPNSALSLDNNNLVNRTRSGNPGYIMGRPVLGGRVHPGESKAVLANVKGMQVMSSVNGECDTTGGFNANFGTSVQFGVDMSVGCSLSLTAAELQNLCVNKVSHTGNYLYDPAPAVTTGQSNIPFWLTSMYNDTSTTKVGIFGNADPLDITQWLDVTQGAFANSEPAYDALKLSCSNFPTGTHYKFQWTYVGSTTNPQAKIMSAEVSYSSQEMKFNNDRTGNTAEQKFPFSVTVDWTYKELNSEKYSPPPPPIIFSVPYDVFYPFQIDSPATRSGGSWAVLALSAVLCVCMVF
eukprot:CAMPEP_0182453286 /NCGR_PEP_ID=MMETSP1319-20130603/411_1 /TAXON_ID=172717 /ORGANISM="Bolidomonas pacifica, Strain RCC208" /LENGTH=696 /DNA_ID=CAMNT_0024651201 /DNA_START=102 /DNA_END=2192 /DNA_ORIENTATION=+